MFEIAASFSDINISQGGVVTHEVWWVF